MPKQFLQLSNGQAVASQTKFQKDVFNQKMITTELKEAIPLSEEDLQQMGLQVGMYKRGSIRLAQMADGTVCIAVRPYNDAPKGSTNSVETLRVTEHCRLTRNKRHWRLVMEVPVRMNAQKVAEIIDDEAWEYSQWLQNWKEETHE